MLAKLSQITAFVFDVDGVLTDGTVLVTESGEQLRRFSIKDGYALQLAVKRGFKIAIITGGRSQSIVSRLTGLGISDVYLGVEHKTEKFEEFLLAYDLSADEILYMGDDVPDYPVMQLVGLPTCPADAAEAREPRKKKPRTALYLAQGGPSLIKALRLPPSMTHCRVTRKPRKGTS